MPRGLNAERPGGGGTYSGDMEASGGSFSGGDAHAPNGAGAGTYREAAAWNGTYYGPAVWFATTTGARLGELCALRWRDLTIQHIDIAHDTDGHDPRQCLQQGCHWVLSISRSIEQVGLEVWEKDSKTHQHRRIALDQKDAAVLIDLRETREAEGKLTDRPVRDSDFIIHHPRGPEFPLRPGAVSIHYSRFVAKLDVAPTTFHKLRHYSATELVAAGIDINTVAGRLGHAGPTTTYNFYAAWKAELDQRAAIKIHGRVPTPPAPAARTKPRKPPVSEVLAGPAPQNRDPGRTVRATLPPSADEGPGCRTHELARPADMEGVFVKWAG
jgi:integrase